MQGRGISMRTLYARGESASRPAPRGLQKVLSEEQIRDTIRRETSRADRTGRQFSVVLFGVRPPPRGPDAGGRCRRAAWRACC